MTMKGVYSRAVLDSAQAIESMWMLVSTAFIFLMVAGYTLYESGQMRRKNATFPLMKNLAITCIAIMAWWLTGYGFAWGAPTKFIGSDGWAFASKGFEKVPVDNYVLWDYELAYLLIACTFFSGSMGERTRLIAYIGWVFLFAFFVYPVVVAWGWAGGWLVRRGYHDYAGSGIVFLAAGTAGFWGSVLLGERYGRKQYREAINKHIDHRIIERVVQERPVCEQELGLSDLAVRQWDTFRPSNNAFMVTGTIIMWVGFLFFNGGIMFAPRQATSAKVFHNTFLAGAASFWTGLIMKGLLMKSFRRRTWYDCQTMCNSILSGLVAVAASVDRIEPWAAVCIGLVAGLVYAIWCKVLQVARVDDVTEGSAVFMMNGFWGLWACGFFDNEFGLFYDDGSKGHYFGYEICGSVVIFAWVSAFAIIYFLLMRALRLLRVSKVQEVVGLDVIELGGFSREDYAKIYQEVKVKIEEEEFGLRKGEANNIVQREHEVVGAKQAVANHLNPENDVMRAKI